MNRMQCFTSTLDKLNLSVSTGRTVDFRAKEYLRQCPQENTAPLIYPCHFHEGFINWPLKSGKNQMPSLNRMRRMIFFRKGLLCSNQKILLKRAETPSYGSDIRSFKG